MSILVLSPAHQQRLIIQDNYNRVALQLAMLDAFDLFVVVTFLLYFCHLAFRSVSIQGVSTASGLMQLVPLRARMPCCLLQLAMMAYWQYGD